jgi:hypothetical protein
MIKTFKKVAFAGIIAGAALAVIYYLLMYTPANVVREVAETSQQAQDGGAAAQRFGDVVEEHKTAVVERVVTIRAKVETDIRAMVPDALVSGVISELELFRGAAADSHTAGSSGVDGEGGKLRRQ